MEALPEPTVYTILDYAGLIPFVTRELYLLGSSPNILSTLTKDRSANRPIFFGTDNYEILNEEFSESSRMTGWKLRSYLVDEDKAFFQSRSQKKQAIKSSRTKQRGEVLTPLWIVNKMIEVLDDEWKRLSLNEYLSKTVLELCCGEAPFLVQRYDPITGDLIPVEERKGVLDRKLHRISESTNSRTTWRDRAYQAYRSTYGYEYQGDSLFLGRENLLFDYIEHHFAKFRELPSIQEINNVATIISWNIFQMDGIRNEIPYFDPQQLELFERSQKPYIKPLISLWESKGHEPKKKDKRRYGDEDMKFDVVIGNPAYQKDDSERSEMPPIYHEFYDQAMEVSKTVLFITPARFLFDSGKTPSKWNRKMLSDPHFKVLKYFDSSKSIFPNVDIKGGVAITYRDTNKYFGAIEHFYPNKTLSEIIKKIKNTKNFIPISEILYSNTSYKYSSLFFLENPHLENKVSGGSKRYLTSTSPVIFEEVFKNDPNSAYSEIICRVKSKRMSLFFPTRYLIPPDNFHSFKIFLSSSNGSGEFGEKLTSPFVGKPEVGATESYMSMGNFKTEKEANNLIKYIKSKFLRCVLGSLKSTQHYAASVWKNTPLQDFSDNSDIDWAKSIQEIDQQLYAKYGLSPEEIEFIETHVKEME